MKVEFRYRANAKESISDRHESFISGILKLAEPWGGSDAPPLPDIGGDLQVDYALQLKADGIEKARLHYVYRSEEYLRDEGQYDDAFFLDINDSLIDYKPFLSEVFPAYLKIYRPYRASIIFDEALSFDDWDEVAILREETGEDIDGRDSVYRIQPVNYFDRELCARAFNLSPEQIVEKLNGRIDSVSLFLDGVLLIASSDVLGREDIERIDSEIKALLK